MALFKGFGIGIKAYSEAHRLIFKKNFWGYLILPGIINIILFFTVFLLGWKYSDVLRDAFFDLIGLSDSPDGFLKYLWMIFHFLMSLIFKLIFLVVYISVYKYVVLALISPALAILSEKTEHVVKGTEYPFHFSQFLSDIFRGIIVVLRNLILEMLWIIAFIFISYIPLIGWLSPVILFFVACYYLGFSFIDYTCERRRLSISASARLIRKNKGAAMANGIMFYLILLIPLVGLLFAPAYATVAATLMFDKLEDK